MDRGLSNDADTCCTFSPCMTLFVGSVGQETGWLLHLMTRTVASGRMLIQHTAVKAWHMRKGILWFSGFWVASNAHAQSPIWATDKRFCLGFLKVSNILLRTAKALARLRLSADSPEPSLVAYVITLYSFGLFTFRNMNIIRGPVKEYLIIILG